MELTELKTLLSKNKDSDEYKSLIKKVFGGSESEAKYEETSVRKFLSENEAGKKILKSFTDSYYDKGRNDYEKNELPKKLDELKNPKKTEQELRLEALERKLAEKEAEAEAEKQAVKKANLLNYALTNTEYKLPSEILEKFIGEDEEKTKANLTVLGETLKGVVTAEFSDFYKNTGKNPEILKKKKEEAKPTDVRHMSSEDFIKYGDKIK